MKVEFAEAAERDLEAIGDFIARDNPARALTFIGELRELCHRLSKFPKRFPPLEGYEQSGIRKAVHGNYLIFFQVTGQTVGIVHVLHGAADYEAVLFPSPQ